MPDTSIFGPLAPASTAQPGPMSMPLLGSPAYQQQQAQRRQVASQLEIQQALDLARTLRQQASPDNERITSPWQVVGKVAEALGGQLQMQRAREMQLGRDAAFASAYMPGGASPGGVGGSVGGSASGAVGSSDDVAAVNKTASDLQIEPRTLAAVMHYESGFNPNSVSDSGKGYPVKGLIGFDPDNVRRYGEPAPTIAGQMPQVGQYLLDRGWKPGVYDPNDLPRLYSIVNHGSLDKNGNPVLGAADINGTVGQHIQRIAQGSYGAADRFLSGGQTGGGQPAALSFSGDNVARTVNALANRPVMATASLTGAPGPSAGAGQPGGPQNAPQSGAGALPPGAIGMGPYGPMFVDPRRVPRKPSLTPDQFRSLFVGADPQQQKMLLDIVQQQNQEIGVPVTGGTVYVHPQDPRIQRFESGLEKGTIRVGGDEYPAYTTLSPTGVPTTRLGIPFGGAGGGAPGSTAPASPAGPQPPAGTPTAPAPAQGGLAPPPANPSVTDLQNFGAAAAANRAGLVRGAETAATNSPEAIQAAAARKKAEEQSAADVKQYSALHTGLSGLALTAAQQIKYLQAARALMDDPGFYSGIGEQYNLAWKRVLSSLGIDPQGALPQEAFRKVMAANLQQQVTDMRGQMEAMGEHGGRLFAAQLPIMEKSAQNPDNSIAANKFLTELALRNVQHTMDMGDMADDYAIKNGALDAKFEKGLRGWIRDNPIFKPEELGHITRFGQTTSAQPAGPQAPPAQPTGPQGSPTGLPSPSSPEEARKLPSGTRFRAPDGSIRVVP